MSYAIIGFGKIGHALAEAFARKGIELSVATIVAVSASAAGAAPRPGYNANGSVAPFDTQSNAGAVGRSVTTARTTALRDCNASSGRLSQYTWGVQQSDLYRVCMDQHGQVE